MIDSSIYKANYIQFYRACSTQPRVTCESYSKDLVRFTKIESHLLNPCHPVQRKQQDSVPLACPKEFAIPEHHAMASIHP